MEYLRFPPAIYQLAKCFTGHAGRYMTGMEARAAKGCCFGLALLLGHKDVLSQGFYTHNGLVAKVRDGVVIKKESSSSAGEGTTIAASPRPEEVIKCNRAEELSRAFWRGQPEVFLDGLAAIMDITIAVPTRTSSELLQAWRAWRNNRASDTDAIIKAPPSPSLSGKSLLLGAPAAGATPPFVVVFVKSGCCYYV